MATSQPPPPPPKPSKPNFNSSSSNNRTTTANNNYANELSRQTNHKENGNHLPSLPPSIEQEKVVMTPRGKTSNSTVILIERKLVETVGDRQHVAGGDHAGIIINKDALHDQKSHHCPPQLTLEFRVFLVSAITGIHSQESRTLRFWFRNWLIDGDKQAQVSQDFFRDLVSPKEFPRGLTIFVCHIYKTYKYRFENVYPFNSIHIDRLYRIHKENHEASAKGIQRNSRARS